MTRLLIADDHPMIRTAVSMLLADSQFDIVAYAGDVGEALSAIAEFNPDLVVLDIAMPGGSGLDVLRTMRSNGDERPVIILTATIDDLQLADALSMAVDGIVMKNSDPAHLLDCLEAVRRGRQWLDPELAERAADFAQGRMPAALSPRERELVGLVKQGLRNREIASRLGITEGTVKVYLHAIFEKLGVSSRTELAIRAGQSSKTPGSDG